MTPPSLDSLSVVIPVFNEALWIRRCVEALAHSAQLADLHLDIVVVDDGSTDGTAEELAALAIEHGVRVVTQANSGRLAARTAGLAEVSEGWVLLLDSRVITAPGSIAWVRGQIAKHPDRTVWCGHVEVDRANAFAAFWSGLVKIGWRRYTANPRLVSFGAEDFDAYPKGTTCLLLPRNVLRSATTEFASLYDDPKLASDDTRLLRYVAGESRIWLSPDFAFRYFGKQGVRGFLRQGYFRGTTFVDGYLGQPGPVRTALLTAMGVGAALVAVGVRRPALGAVGFLAASAAMPVIVGAVGGERREVRAAAALAPAFIVTFGAGVVRGVALAGLRLVRTATATRKP